MRKLLKIYLNSSEKKKLPSAIFITANMKRVLSDYTNSQTLKKIKQPEALQELYRLRPEFNGKPVYFFCKKTLYIEGLLVYDKQDKIFYVFDKTTGEKFNSFASWFKFLKIKKIFGGERLALATIFFEPNTSGFNLSSILRTKPIPYWKNYNSATIIEVTSLIKKNINSKQEFFSIGLKEIINGIGIIFFGKGQRIVKNLIFKWQENLISYELYVLEKNIKEIDGVATKIAIERTLSEIEKIINYVLKAKICTGQMTEENKSQPDEAYRRIDCLLLVININICKNCQKLKNTLIKIKNRNSMGTLPTKVAHASQEVLAKKIQLQRKKIANQEQIIHTLQVQLQQKVEEEEEKISNELGQIAKEWKSKWSQIPSNAGHAAYDAMKGIMRLPSISTIKNYINESQQHSGWQNKTTYHILEKMAVENIGNHGRIGFFSHDSFKIQKGLLWSQRDNRYVGYLDFENEKEELQSFLMQCEKELQGENTSNLPNPKDHNQGLATQVHQIIWHSATCNFAYPIAYYGINTLTRTSKNTYKGHM
ncbi:hypothetical protein RhiirA5_436214 [Rhizophagus irregularis]|uniref:Uncharacterized protein n=1 Tax=Rhizophagus irregularis TaxID=588596 RepID=A0A2N0NM86_9GLOM|nr:hypothetical protein RhiirA5_436214 [Rhizophagus irregularis]